MYNVQIQDVWCEILEKIYQNKKYIIIIKRSN